MNECVAANLTLLCERAALVVPDTLSLSLSLSLSPEARCDGFRV